MFGSAGTDVFRYDATSVNSGDAAANGHDTINGAAGDMIDMAGLNDELLLNGTLLNALSANVTLGSAISAGNCVAFSGGVLQVDLGHDGVFDAASDFQIT